MRERTFGDPEIQTAAVDQKQKWSLRGFVPEGGMRDSNRVRLGADERPPRSTRHYSGNPALRRPSA
jgi:hypothetical protein